MKWQDLITDAFQRIIDMLEPALKGLTADDLNWQPKPDANSVGWIVWHLTRVQDAHIADLIGQPQLWVIREWHSRFNLPPDPDDTGYGHTPEKVRAFKSPQTETLLNYLKDVIERTKRYLNTLSLEDLDRVLDEPWYDPRPTVGVRLVSVLADGLEHAGEVAYLRGLRKGKGWSG